MNTRLVKRCELQVFDLDRNPVLWRRSPGPTQLAQARSLLGPATFCRRWASALPVRANCRSRARSARVYLRQSMVHLYAASGRGAKATPRIKTHFSSRSLYSNFLAPRTDGRAVGFRSEQQIRQLCVAHRPGNVLRILTSFPIFPPTSTARPGPTAPGPCPARPSKDRRG